MGTPSHPDLERRVLDHGIPRRHLYPWWYRLYWMAGLRLDPPILYSLTQHVLVEGVSIAVILIVGSLFNWWVFGARPFVLAPMLCLAVIIPLLNWRRYRTLRGRIGLDEPG